MRRREGGEEICTGAGPSALCARRNDLGRCWILSACLVGSHPPRTTQESERRSRGTRMGVRTIQQKGEG
jgi:hypothetical protein